MLVLLAIASGATVALASATTAAKSQDTHDIIVAAHRDGAAIVLDVEMRVAATPPEAWAVLTDYDHMADFVSSLTMSRVIARRDGKLEVAQASHFEFGLFRFDFENVREIGLDPPREIRSTLIRGDMLASAFATRLVPEGQSTRIINHGRFVPDRWIPPLIGIAVLKAETRKQFGELRAEILRRTRCHDVARRCSN